MRIICIGSASKDIFFPTDKGLIIETPGEITSQRKIAFELGAKYQIEDRYESPGGVAANVAQGLARLGVKAGCYSKIGTDTLGKWIIEELEKEGVEISLLQIEEGVSSDLSAILVDSRSGERTIFFNRDANEKLEIIPEKIGKPEWIFISALNGNTQKNWDELLTDIITLANERKIKIAFNPGQRNIQDSAEKVIFAIKNSEIVILNKDEAIEVISAINQEFTSKQLISEKFLVKELKKLGPKIVALTDGQKGSWAYDGEKIIYSKSINNRPIETTGAGDAFFSGFLSAILKEKSMEEAIRWGAANGGNVVNFFGAKAGLLKEEEMLEKIKEIKIEKVE